MILRNNELSQVRIEGGPKYPDRILIVLSDGRVWEAQSVKKIDDDGSITPCIEMDYQ
jgi:hypothetical protein